MKWDHSVEGLKLQKAEGPRVFGIYEDGVLMVGTDTAPKLIARKILKMAS